MDVVVGVSRAVLMGILSEVHVWLSELETDLSRLDPCSSLVLGRP